MSRSRVARWLPLALLAACAVEDSARVVAPTPRPQEGWIDVELAAGAKLPALACGSGVRVLDAEGKERLRLDSIPAGSEVRVTEHGVTLAGRELGEPPVELHPAGTARLAARDTSYRGDLRLEWSATQRAGRLVNRVALEDYLLGVVPAEMPDRFGLEALKAQAVAARSYALAESARQGFVYGDTRSQAYEGRSGETPLASRAVRETLGELLEHKGRVIKAWYHSTCGGSTVPAATVFDDAQRGVLDRAVSCPDCKASPFFDWERRYDDADVCKAMGVAVAPLESAAAPADDFPARPAALAVIVDGKATSVPLTDLRSRLSAGRPLSKQMLSTNLAAPPRVVDGQLVVHGRGYGHGVGLCQYGAAGFAARGASYRAILERYYPGATLAAAP
jgi:stage II sporulation protein D